MGSPFSEKLIEMMRTRMLGCNSKRCMKAPFGKMQCIAMLVINGPWKISIKAHVSSKNTHTHILEWTTLDRMKI